MAPKRDIEGDGDGRCDDGRPDGKWAAVRCWSRKNEFQDENAEENEKWELANRASGRQELGPDGQAMGPVGRWKLPTSGVVDWTWTQCFPPFCLSCRETNSRAGITGQAQRECVRLLSLAV